MKIDKQNHLERRRRATQFFDYDQLLKHEQRGCSMETQSEATGLDHPVLSPTNSVEDDYDDSAPMQGWEDSSNFGELHGPGPSQATPEIEETRPGVLTKNKEKCSKRNRPLYKCKYEGCDFTSRYSQNVARHFPSHSGERFDCGFCEKTFGQPNTLRAHEKLHSGFKPHTCDECDYATSNITALRRHELIHKNEYPYKCKVCPFAGRTAKQLENHRNRKHDEGTPLVCPYCGTTRRVKNDMNRHIQTHTGEKPFKCELCNTAFTRKVSLRDHVLLKHTNTAAGNVSDSTSSSEAVKCQKRSPPKKLKCESDGCEYTCAYPNIMKQHMNIHIEERPYQCSTCQATFSHKKSLKTHELRHSGLKPHKCDHCEYATADISCLRRHVLVHKNEYPFKCKLCSFAARRSDRLAVHRMRAHPPEVQCPRCNTTCKQNSDLETHICSNTGENLYKCQVCNYYCSTKENLTSHENEKHSTSPSNVYNLRSRSKRSLHEQDKTHVVDAAQSSDSEGNQPNEDEEQGGPTKTIKIESELPKLASELVKTEYGVEEEGEDEPIMAIKIKSELIEDVSEHSDGDESMTTVNGNQEAGERSSTSVPSMPSGSTRLVSADITKLTELLQTTPPASKKRRVVEASTSTVSTTNSHETLVSAAIASSDIHTCGACKAQFLDLYLFLKHKQQECSVVADPIVLQEQQYDHHSASLSSAMSDPTQVDLTPITKIPVTEPPQKTLPAAKKHGPPPKRFKCERCNLACDTCTDLICHSRTHTGDRPYQCSICPASFIENQQLKIHERWHADLKPHKCNECNYATDTLKNLNAHSKIHTIKNPFKCKICPYAGHSSAQLTSHELSAHLVDSQFTCPRCETTFKFKSDLKCHTCCKIDVLPYKCQLCNFSCAIKGDLATHMQLKHSTSATTNVRECPASSQEKLQELEKLHLAKAVQSPDRDCIDTESDDEQHAENEINVNCGQRKHQSEDTTSRRTTASMETPFGTNTARKSMKITCATSSSRTNGGRAFSGEVFECHRETSTDSLLPSRVLRQDEPTTSSMIIESEPPNVTSELVKVEPGVVDEITPRGNDRQEQKERSQTSIMVTEIKVEPEWDFS